MEYINKIIHGDCLEKLKELPDNSVDSIVTDPPAGISFMGKSWDTDKGGRDNWIKWMQEVATECKRVLKPGGHAFVWVIPRTSHWTATAWENAGFEIRDVVAHVFGSGFPKSHNVEKAVQKIQPERSNEFKGIGTALKPAREDWILMRKPLAEKTVAENCLKYGTGGINIDESRVDFISEEDRKESTTKNQHADFGTKPMINNNVYGDYSMIQPKNFNPTGRFPANLILSDCEEVRECFPETKPGGKTKSKELKGDIGYVPQKRDIESQNRYAGDSGNASRFFKSIKTGGQSIGRFPANLIHDNSEEVRECFPDTKAGVAVRRNGNNANGIFPVKISEGSADVGFNDSGNASRFFKSIIYQAKASKSERNKGCEGLEESILARSGGAQIAENNGEEYEECQGIGLNRVSKMKNNHPTVKPIALMEYLIKMVTPKGGTVLDPFAGSGSTLVAAKQNGYQYIGIEMTEEYIPIINARLGL